MNEFNSKFEAFNTDCLVISSLDELNRAKFNIKPIIILVKASEISWVYSMSLDGIDRIIILKDTYLFNRKLLPSHLISVIIEPVETIGACQLSKESVILKNPKILIKIESVFLNFDPLYNIVRLINSLSHFSVKLVGASDDMAALFNKNIQLVDEATVELIKETDLVVGSGSFIQKCIALGKPAIVVGYNGLGGFVSENSIETLYEFLFAGRPGGSYNELIPENLLYECILETLNIELIETLNANIRFLTTKRKEYDAFMKESILLAESNFKNRKTLTKDSKLLFSTDFSLTSLGRSNVAINYIPLARVHSFIEKEEAFIIEAFRETATVKTVAKEQGYQDDFENFMEFIQELINEQILLVQ